MGRELWRCALASSYVYWYSYEELVFHVLFFSLQGIFIVSLCFMCNFLWFLMLGKKITLTKIEWEKAESRQNQDKGKIMPKYESENKVSVIRRRMNICRLSVSFWWSSGRNWKGQKGMKKNEKVQYCQELTILLIVIFLARGLHDPDFTRMIHQHGLTILFWDIIGNKYG